MFEKTHGLIWGIPLRRRVQGLGGEGEEVQEAVRAQALARAGTVDRLGIS